MTYKVYNDKKRGKLIVTYNPHMQKGIDIIYYTFYDGEKEGLVSQGYLSENCDLVLETEGKIYNINEQLQGVMQ